MPDVPDSCIEDSGFKLLEGEKLYKIIKPHPLSFIDMYFMWVLVILLSLLFLVYGDSLGELIGNPAATPLFIYDGFLNSSSENLLIRSMPYLTETRQDIYEFTLPLTTVLREYAPVSLWIFLLTILSILVSFLKIALRWCIILPAAGITSLIVAVALDLDPRFAYFFGILFSLVGVLMVELYRRAHTFYVTGSRLVTEATFLTRKKNELGYDKINNVVLDQSLVGRVFNFGTLIPATASGLGMGEDSAYLGFGAAGEVGSGPLIGGGAAAGRSITVPRTRSMYSLFGVSNPAEIEHLISALISDFREAPHLKDIKKTLGQMRDHMQEDNL
ncbi:MAG: PH domain-containing protein [Candidatus Altiarchaeales archaeon]|nr:PH domain-containing protein [Candidatus Altiarchaeales archaeon]